MPNTHRCMGACIALAALSSARRWASRTPADRRRRPSTRRRSWPSSATSRSWRSRSSGSSARPLRGQEVNRAALPFVQAQVLAEIISHRLVMSYAKRQGDLPTAAEISAGAGHVSGRAEDARQNIRAVPQERAPA